MEAIIQHIGEVQFEAHVRGHKVICDQPLEAGGYDEGMTPPEFLLVSLGTCAGYYAAEYLKARKLPAEGLEVRVNADKAKQPARLGRFHIDVKVPGLDARHEAGLMKAVKACLIHNTLLNTPVIETSVNASTGSHALAA